MSSSNYQETLDFLYAQLPMFQRVGAVAFKKDLGNTKALCKSLGNPEKRFKSIHIAGTNGKGSVSHMLAAVLQAAGFKTGLYTSPHLRDFRERIRINGEMIAEQEVVAFTEKMLPVIAEVSPSFFELTVAMAFDHFAKNEVEIAVIETGLGGRLDSTNVITPILSVITNIGWDHMDLLGDNLPLIAAEKAGIIKADVPVIVGEFQEDVAAVFEQHANERRSLLKFASKSWEARHSTASNGLQFFDVFKNGKLKLGGLATDQLGIYQAKNLVTVLAAVEQLQAQGWDLEEDSLRSGLASVGELTGFKGRWSILQKEPLVVADTAHNEPGIKLLVQQIAQTPHDKLHMVISMVKDKDIDKVLSLLPKNAIYYFSKAGIPRGLEAELLFEKASQHGLQGATFVTLNEAYNEALTKAGKYDLVLIGGSTFTVAELI